MPTDHHHRQTDSGHKGVAMKIFATAVGLAILPLTSMADSLKAPACIETYQIDHTKTPDNRTVIFYMKGGASYQSTLASDCPMLRFNGFAYVATPPARICGGLQSIKVLRTGLVCLLGPLVPITPSSKKSD